MKMPSKTKKKWLKALRSGEYGQAIGRLTDGDGNFCCLGVLQHCVSGGYVEAWDDNGAFHALPTPEWLSDNQIKISDRAEARGDVMQDRHIDRLTAMNDGNWSLRGKGRKSFKTIANWIEKNIETTD